LEGISFIAVLMTVSTDVKNIVASEVAQKYSTADLEAFKIKSQMKRIKNGVSAAYGIYDTFSTAAEVGIGLIGALAGLA
jgi:hypothetical protein